MFNSLYTNMMHLRENEVRALILITCSLEPAHPSGLQKEMGLLKELCLPWIITSLQNIGLVERAGGQIRLASMHPAEAFKQLFYSHRVSPLSEILSGQMEKLLFRLGQSPPEPGSPGCRDRHIQRYRLLLFTGFSSPGSRKKIQ